jgi:hypothetical protein
MPDVTFNCPHCRQSIEAPDEMAGMAAQCPTCHEELEIPINNVGVSRLVAPLQRTSSGNPLNSPVSPNSPGNGYPSSSLQFIAASCPSCGGDLRVPQDREQVICGYCGKTVLIPKLHQLVIVSNQEATESELSGKCPYCAKLIPLIAERCPHCTKDMDTADWLYCIPKTEAGEIRDALEERLAKTYQDIANSSSADAEVRDIAVRLASGYLHNPKYFENLFEERKRRCPQKSGFLSKLFSAGLPPPQRDMERAHTFIVTSCMEQVRRFSFKRQINAAVELIISGIPESNRYVQPDPWEFEITDWDTARWIRSRVIYQACSAVFWLSKMSEGESFSELQRLVHEAKY